MNYSELRAQLQASQAKVEKITRQYHAVVAEESARQKELLEQIQAALIVELGQPVVIGPPAQSTVIAGLQYRRAETLARIQDLKSQGMKWDQIAQTLNDESFRPAKGDRFTGPSVSQLARTANQLSKQAAK